MAGCSAIAGSTRIGRYCQIGGAVGITGHLTIADRVVITAMSLVTRSLHEAGTYSSGMPAQESTQWRRNAACFKQLYGMSRRMRELEKDRAPRDT